MKRVENTVAAASPTVWVVYLATVFMLTLTGFAQMPIFKRYYIADIPGLGWLAQFYVTHLLHYIGAIVLLALLAYVVAHYLMVLRRNWRITASGYVRVLFLGGILATGIPRVIKNFEGYYLSSGMIIFLDLLHLAMVMGFLLASLYCAVRRRPWVVRVSL
jgi:hypothetical protein